MVETISIADIQEFKRCSLRYKLTKIDKLDQSLNEDDGLKEALETTVSYFYYHLQDGKLLSMTDLKEKFGSIWYGKMDLYDIQINSDQTKRKKELQAISMLSQLHRRQKYNQDKVIAVNLDFRVPFGDDFIVQDKIPLIRETDKGYEIVNFKSSKTGYSTFWQKTDMTVTLHAMAFESMFKRQADTICVENLNGGTTFYVNRTRKDYQRLYKTIKMMKKTIDQGWFYPNESYLCNKCPVRLTCMEWR